MKGKTRTLMACCAVLTLLFLVSSTKNALASKTIIQIHAAVSLKEALIKLDEIYSRKEPQVELHFHLAASGTLRKEIEDGAPVDLIITADEKDMDALAAEGFIVPETRTDLLGNELVLIVGKKMKNVIKSFSDLASKKYSLCIGQPEHVPAGMYSKETLINMKLWDKVQKNIVYANDVRQVPILVEAGYADAGLVYRSDAVALESHVVAVAPRGSHSPIIYPMAALKASKKLELTKKFMEFLRTPEAAKVFINYKFIPLKEDKVATP